MHSCQQLLPKKIKRIKEEDTPSKEKGVGLEIVWADGATSTFPARLLRENCPCATCIGKRGDTSHDKPLSGKQTLLRVIEADIATECNLVEIRLVGNYAVSFIWGDGHDSGIYTYQYLRELDPYRACQKSSCDGSGGCRDKHQTHHCHNHDH